jgi:FMN-dependent NADH-azoreductase
MKKILHLISSPNGDQSYSIKLGRAVVAKLQEANPGATVQEFNLIAQDYPHLDASHLKAFYTPPAQRSAEDEAAVRHSDAGISQLMEADFIVIGAPLYNFSIHSSLKAWIDHIARAGVTFKYGEQGPEGLVKGKKVYVAMASGGVYSEGAMQSYDFVAPYLKAVLGFLGMTDLKTFRVEGVSIPGIKEDALQKGLDSIVL